MPVAPSEVVDLVRRLDVGRGQLVGLVVDDHGGRLGLALIEPGVDGPGASGRDDIRSIGVEAGPSDAAALVGAIDSQLGPRWVLWSNATASVLEGRGVRLARCWDLAAVHRLLVGGWRAEPDRVWAHVRGLPPDSLPAEQPHDLFSSFDLDDLGAQTDPIDADGYLRPQWVAGGWSTSADQAGQWAALALEAAGSQLSRLEALTDHPTAPATARSESAAELLCVDLAADGLPVDRGAAERLIAGFVGPRPTSAADAAGIQAERQREVLRHAPPGSDFDLRSPAQVKSLLRRVGVEVPDTRAHRLETMRDAHPIIGPILAFRKAERISTTYGYAWIDEHVGPDGRLRGTWTGCDGAAGRMTASSGLHNLPADLRSAVVAEPGHVLIRSDLGQVEPRVLAAVSRDGALARACEADDLYAPVAAQLGVDRATAKVAVLGAMYGQTTGRGAQALRRLERAFPVAMAYLDDAARRAEAGQDLRTHGGRLIPMTAEPPLVSPDSDGLAEREHRSRAAARGRYGRNAMVQGAAAELFKVWAVTVRARLAGTSARIVLCLHDELLVHAPEVDGAAVAALVDDCLLEAVRRWAPSSPVRFLADTAVVNRWSDAK